MKTRIYHRLKLVGTCLLTGVLFASVETVGRDLFRYPLKEASAQIWVRGTSTLGKWDCSQHGIKGFAQFNTSADQMHDQLAELLTSPAPEDADASEWQRHHSDVRVAIDANGFDCENNRMKRDLVEAIRAEQHPTIDFRFTRLDGVSVHVDESRGPYLDLTIRGQLLFGGVECETVHKSSLWLNGDSTIVVTGTLDLQMSDFGINPPSAVFGLIRSQDRFQVDYNIELETDATRWSGSVITYHAELDQFHGRTVKEADRDL